MIIAKEFKNKNHSDICFKNMNSSFPEKNNLPLSIVLPTIYRRDLIRSTLSSVLPQMRESDEILVSLNVEPKEVARCKNDLIEYISGFSLPSDIIVNFVSPAQFIAQQYTHWNFAIAHARYSEIVFIHDDEIYNADLLCIARTEFSADSQVTLVTGGQINVRPVASDFRVFRTVRFHERKVYEAGTWLEVQENPWFPKFGATVYVFRRQETNHWFLEDNVRISDALLIYQLAVRGKVIERPEVFGTHLQHAGNTALGEYLNVGHVPYWLGLRKLGELENEIKLIAASDLIKSEAIKTYSQNAVAAALPKGDRSGWNECLRQCELAGGKPHWLIRLIDMLPWKWIILPPLARAAKSIFRMTAPNRGRGKLTGERVSLKECLKLTDVVIRDFKERAVISARR